MLCALLRKTKIDDFNLRIGFGRGEQEVLANKFVMVIPCERDSGVYVPRVSDLDGKDHCCA